MTDLSQIREHMEVIGADGVHIGIVDKVEEHRIKLTKADSGSHQDHHHYLSTGLIAAVEGKKSGFPQTAIRQCCWRKKQEGKRSQTNPDFDYLQGFVGINLLLLSRARLYAAPRPYRLGHAPQPLPHGSRFGVAVGKTHCRVLMTISPARRRGAAPFRQLSAR